MLTPRVVLDIRGGYGTGFGKPRGVGPGMQVSLRCRLPGCQGVSVTVTGVPSTERAPLLAVPSARRVDRLTADA